MTSLSLLTQSVGSELWSGAGVKNSPGSLRVDPYTISAVVHPRSSLRVDLMPRRTNGSASLHLSGCWLHFSADLRCLWNRSIMPFDMG